MDYVDPNSSDPAKEREDDMSSLVVGFVVRMPKRAASTQGETILDFEVSGKKCSKWSGPDEGAWKIPTIIFVNSLERSFDALPALEGASQDDSREACASSEDEVPFGGLPNID